MIAPDAQRLAGHIPADVYAQLPADARVVVVQVPAPPARRYPVGPAALILCTTVGIAGVVVALLALVQVASETAAALAAAAPTAGGISLSIAIRRNK